MVTFLQIASYVYSTYNTVIEAFTWVGNLLHRGTVKVDLRRLRYRNVKAIIITVSTGQIQDMRH